MSNGVGQGCLKVDLHVFFAYNSEACTSGTNKGSWELQDKNIGRTGNPDVDNLGYDVLANRN